MTKLWGGRFTESASAQAEAFGASISFDQKLAAVDLQGSLAHAQMLYEQGILDETEWQQIEAGLNHLQTTIDQHVYSLADEDIHMNLERLLTEQIGPVAGKLHTARSRNDQVATDLHLWMEQHVLRTPVESSQSAIRHHGTSGSTCRNGHAGLYPSAAGATDFARASLACLLLDV